MTKIDRMKEKMYLFHSDLDYGWVAVKRVELVILGIVDKISTRSYQKGSTIYIDYVYDWGVFEEAFSEVCGKIPMIKKSKNQSTRKNASHILDYEPYKPWRF